MAASFRLSSTSRYFSSTPLPLPPSRCCDGLCLLEQHTHLGAATHNQKLKQGLSEHGHYLKGGLELLWINLTVSWMFLLYSYIATGCVTLKDPTGAQEVLAGTDKVMGCLFDTLVTKKRIMGKF